MYASLNALGIIEPSEMNYIPGIISRLNAQGFDHTGENGEDLTFEVSTTTYHQDVLTYIFKYPQVSSGISNSSHHPFPGRWFGAFETFSIYWE